MLNKSVKPAKGKKKTEAGTFSPERMRRHKLASEIYSETEKLERALMRTKSGTLEKIRRYRKDLLKKGVADENDLSNLNLTNNDGTVQVLVRSSEVIEFSDDLKAAKAAIDQCLQRWGSESHPYLHTVIKKLFRIDKKGVINKNALLGLFQFDIKDKEWQNALDLIRKSIILSTKKAYVQIRSRENSSSAWKTKNLNFSSIEPGWEKEEL